VTVIDCGAADSAVELFALSQSTVRRSLIYPCSSSFLR
jgi:hypothetical protein